MPKATEKSDVLHLTNGTFDGALAAASGPVLVDFWAEWCPPCRALSPTIERLATEMKGSAVVAKVDVDEAKAVAARFGIQSIPTMIIFKDGREVDRVVGVRDAAALRALLEGAAA